MRRNSSTAGFTLIELLVSMLVFLVVLMVTNGLLVESLRIFSNSGRELREPGTALALRMLREDLHAGRPLPAGIAATHTRLTCERPDRFEVWEMDERRLVRRTYDPAGTLLGTRPMLDGMIEFFWETTTEGTVHVRLLRRKPAGASALRVATAAWRSVGDELEQADILAVSRISGTTSP